MDGEVKRGPSLLCQILPSQAEAEDRTQKFAFEKHSCDLPGNIRDKGKMIKVIYLKSDCKSKIGSHFSSSQVVMI